MIERRESRPGMQVHPQMSLRPVNSRSSKATSTVRCPVQTKFDWVVFGCMCAFVGLGSTSVCLDIGEAVAPHASALIQILDGAAFLACFFFGLVVIPGVSVVVVCVTLYSIYAVLAYLTLGYIPIKFM